VPAVFDALRQAQLAYKAPGDELVAAYNAGKLTPANAKKVLETVARSAAEAHAAQGAVLATEYDLTMDFLARLKGTAGDELIEAVRPVFDRAVAGLQSAAEHLPAEVTAEQVLAFDSAEAVNAWNDQPSHAAVLDKIYSTIVHPLVGTFNATAARAFDDPRQPLVAYVINPAGTSDLYGAAHLMGAAPMSYGRGGRWRALISHGSSCTSTRHRKRQPPSRPTSTRRTTPPTNRTPNSGPGSRRGSSDASN
jgi:hypothetical protein